MESPNYAGSLLITFEVTGFSLFFLLEFNSAKFKLAEEPIVLHGKNRRKEKEEMYTMSYNPFGKLNLKAVILVPMLLLTLFPMVPFVSSQVAPNISKITPTLMNELANAGESINVLIKTVSHDYAAVVQQIGEIGGKVGNLFKYVNGLSASVPASKIIELTRNSLIERMYFDTPRQMATIPSMSPVDDLLAKPTVEAETFETVAFTDDVMPENYWNTIGMGAEPIWDDTNMGADSLVVVIDTGIWLGHFMFTPKVSLGEIAGGIDVSPDVGTAYFGWDMPSNHWHGSHTAGTVASRGGLVAAPGSPLFDYYANGLEMYSGIPLPLAPSPPYPAGSKIIWTLGMAPAASLYIVKVFDHTGGAVDESYILAGMEHALDLKVNQGVDVDVISMSIGGATIFDGRDFEDQLVDTITASGITLVGAAGNEGPASMTVGSPGSAYTAITAGAAEDEVHSKSFFDYAYRFVGIGDYMFVNPNPVIADYSSRGPTSDGRLKPTLVATGSFVLSAYPTGGLQRVAWGSGTSMATPAISGATALINAYAEMHSIAATPEDYKQALIAGAVWLPDYAQYDQGAGYLNAANALAAFEADPSYGDVAPRLREDGQLADISNIPIVTAGVYTTSVSGIAPEHRVEFVFQVTETTNSIKIDVTNIDLGYDALGLNYLGLYVQSSKRTTTDYYINGALMFGDSSFTITDDATTYTGDVLPTPATLSHVIEPGYFKVVLMTYYQSFDSTSADIRIEVTKAKKTTPTLLFSGHVFPFQAVGWIRVPVPAGTTKAIVELWWTHDWQTYPTSDLDLYIYVNGAYNLNGATLNSPERVVINGPTGTMYFLIDGYAIEVGREPFELRITFV